MAIEQLVAQEFN